MKVGVIGSMQFAEKMIHLRDELRRLGHESFTSKFVDTFVGKSDSEKEIIKLDQKYNQYAIREDCEWVKDMDAILVANYDKDGVINYIGGNAFIEMAYAFILRKKLFLINPIPDMPYYGTELIAMRPLVTNNDLGKVK